MKNVLNKLIEFITPKSETVRLISALELELSKMKSEVEASLSNGFIATRIDYQIGNISDDRFDIHIRISCVIEGQAEFILSNIKMEHIDTKQSCNINVDGIIYDNRISSISTSLYYSNLLSTEEMARDIVSKILRNHSYHVYSEFNIVLAMDGYAYSDQIKFYQYVKLQLQEIDKCFVGLPNSSYKNKITNGIANITSQIDELMVEKGMIDIIDMIDMIN